MSERKLRKNKNYSEETLQLALKEIQKGFSCRSISLKYKIPQTTLQRKIQLQKRPAHPEIQDLVKEEDASIIEIKEDNDFSDIEEVECDSIEEYFSTSPLEKNWETDVTTKTMPEIKFEKNESVKSSLCFACSALITEIELTTGIRCFSCLRTYHITCAYKQEMEKQLNAEITEPFSCLVCWKKLNN